MKKNFEIARKELSKQVSLLIESKAYNDDSVKDVLIDIAFNLDELISFLKVCEKHA